MISYNTRHPMTIQKIPFLQRDGFHLGYNQPSKITELTGKSNYLSFELKFECCEQGLLEGPLKPFSRTLLFSQFLLRGSKQ